MKTGTAVGLVILAAAAAGAADMGGYGTPAPAFTPQEPAGTRELTWDNGTRAAGLTFYQGNGSWVGNDFDISTLSSFRHIRTIKVYTCSNWPNQSWDGFRVAIFRFVGGQPGTYWWGPVFYLPTSGSGWTWVDVPVGYYMPPGNDGVIAAMEQYYNYPNCEPYAIDDNHIFLGHSWQYYQGSWRFLQPEMNLMLRVVVDDEHSAVTPSSWGRVKAVYYQDEGRLQERIKGPAD